MDILKVIILAIVQGLAELLPVSSSAHVIVAEKLLGLDPSSPQMTLLLVMLHTGTMFAVIAYFWKTWKAVYFSSADAFKRFAILLIWATAVTGAVGEVLKKLIEKTLFRNAQSSGIEQLFSHLELIAPALAAAGIVILLAGAMERTVKKAGYTRIGNEESTLRMKQAAWMGVAQGLALPFRGFSRSGATISTGILTGTAKGPAERFSFAMAIIVTPPLIAIELARLVRASHAHVATGASIDLHASLLASLVGTVFSFIAGLLALKWLSKWLEAGRWYLFGIYCLCASAVVYLLHAKGY